MCSPTTTIPSIIGPIDPIIIKLMNKEEVEVRYDLIRPYSKKTKNFFFFLFSPGLGFQCGSLHHHHQEEDSVFLFSLLAILSSSFLHKGREKTTRRLVLSFFWKQATVSGLCFWELAEELEEAAVVCCVVEFSF